MRQLVQLSHARRNQDIETRDVGKRGPEKLFMPEALGNVHGKDTSSWLLLRA